MLIVPVEFTFWVASSIFRLVANVEPLVTDMEPVAEEVSSATPREHPSQENLPTAPF